MSKPPTPEEMAKEAITWHLNRANFGVVMRRGFAEGVQAERDRVRAAVPEHVAVDHRSSTADVSARGFNACRALWIESLGVGEE